MTVDWKSIQKKSTAVEKKLPKNSNFEMPNKWNLNFGEALSETIHRRRQWMIEETSSTGNNFPRFLSTNKNYVSVGAMQLVMPVNFRKSVVTC